MNISLPLTVSVILASSLIGCTELAIGTRSDPAPLYTTGPTYVEPAPAYQSAPVYQQAPTYVTPAPTYVTPGPAYVPEQRAYDTPQRVVVEQPRYERNGRGDLDYSVNLLKHSMSNMNNLLRSYGRDNYGRLKDELATLNTRVDNFQTLVNRHERNNVLRDYFNDIEKAAGAMDLHIRGMNADRPVNEAWQNVGEAYRRVSDDINYRSASER